MVRASFSWCVEGEKNVSRREGCSVSTFEPVTEMSWRSG